MEQPVTAKRDDYLSLFGVKDVEDWHSDGDTAQLMPTINSLNMLKNKVTDEQSVAFFLYFCTQKCLLRLTQNSEMCLS
jgi:hypothetical protein